MFDFPFPLNSWRRKNVSARSEEDLGPFGEVGGALGRQPKGRMTRFQFRQRSWPPKGGRLPSAFSAKNDAYLVTAARERRSSG
jgi:hypothetical protein